MKALLLVSLVVGSGLMAACSHPSNTAPTTKPLTQQQIEQRWKAAQNPKVEEQMYEKYKNSLPKGGKSGLGYDLMQGVKPVSPNKSKSQQP